MIRKCLSCGKEHGPEYTRTMCSHCKTLLTIQQCTMCKEWLPNDSYYVYASGVNKGYLNRRCKQCTKTQKTERDKANREQHLARNRRKRDKQRRIAEERLAEWKELTDIPFVMLTEKEWLNTCSYFGGCAVCGADHIEARQFFINFEHGGRYTPWNMYPICGQCAKLVRKIENPFAWLDKHLSPTMYKTKYTEASRDRLIAFLRSKAGEYSEKQNKA